jgi:hypothetical protein
LTAPASLAGVRLSMIFLRVYRRRMRATGERVT